MSRRMLGSLSTRLVRLASPLGTAASTMQSHGNSVAAKTAGIIVIGDEILKGQVQDSNIQVMTKSLHDLGVQVKRVLVIEDNVDVIADEVEQFSQKFTYVVTSGGIGPTHDDVTYEGVAKAFSLGLHLHPDLVELMKLYFKTDDLNSPSMKMANVPISTQLHYGIDPSTGQRTWVPIVSVKNVFIFPGIPHLLKKAFRLLQKDLFDNTHHKFYEDKIFLNVDEVTIAPILNEVVAKHSRVTFGSYPEIFHSYYKVRLTLESQDKATVKAAKEDLFRSIPAGSVVNYDDDPLNDCIAKLDSIISDEHLKLGKAVLTALDAVRKCYTNYKPEEVAISFNGGKDCTVILHLCHVVAQKLGLETRLQAFHIHDAPNFPEMEEFIADSTRRYKLDLTTLYGSMRHALATLKTQKPKIKVAVMGMRASDPGSATCSVISVTDKDWPEYIRASPIMQWDYHEVWRFLTSLCLPYCSLYDRGYTSIGAPDNTTRNELLRYEDGWGRVRYRPAHMLENTSTERNGRTRL